MSDHEFDYLRRFGGIQRLYGQTGLEAFQQAHVCVIGIGGVGSWAVESLARSAIGEVTLIDLDNIAESNVNRQLHALSGEFGKPKILAMQERIQGINPDCKTHLIEDFISNDNIPDYIHKEFDFVIDCIDTANIKAHLIAHCKRNKIKMITIGGAGGQIDPLNIKQVDLAKTEHDALLAKTRKLLRTDYGFSRNLKRRFDIPCVFSDEQLRFPDENGEVSACKPEGVHGLSCAGGIGSVTPVTASFANIAVAHVLRKLSKQ